MKLKNIIITLCCFGIAGGVLFAANPAERGTKSRHTTLELKQSAEIPFYIYPFNDGYYVAAYGKTMSENMTFGVLDNYGKLISEKFPSSPDFFTFANDSMLIVNSDINAKIIRLDGSVRKSFPYINIYHIGNGLFAFNQCGDYGSQGLMDIEGNVLFPLTELASYSGVVGDNIITCKNLQTTGTGIITPDGEVVADFVYDIIGKPKNGWIAAVKGDKAGFIDYQGNVMVPFIYDYYDYWGDSDSDPLPMYAVDGVGVVCKDDKWGAVDAEGKVVIPFKYNGGGVGSKGTIVMYADDMEYYFDSTGRNTGRLQRKGATGGDVDDIHLFYDNAKDKVGYVDNKGRIVIQPIYDRGTEFCGPTALVKKDGYWHLVDKSGKIVKRKVARYALWELAG